MICLAWVLWKEYSGEPVFNASGVRAARECSWCHGKGVVEEEVDCSVCHGRGEVAAPLSGVIELINVVGEGAAAWDNLEKTFHHKASNAKYNRTAGPQPLTCRYCNRGKVSRQVPCKHCGGSGHR